MKIQKDSTLYENLGYSTLLYYTIFQILMAILGGIIFRNTETFLVPIFISVFTVALITLVILFFNVRISSAFFLFTLYTIIILFILVNRNQPSITLLVLFLAIKLFIISLLFYHKNLAISLIVIVLLVAGVDALFQRYDVYRQHDALHLTIKEYVFMASYVFAGFLVMSIAFSQTFNHLHVQYLNENKKLLESKQELLDYKEKLEHLVEIRTDELRQSNEELKKQQKDLENSNEELNVTNEELYHQKEYLEEAMQKLKKAQAQLIQSEKMVSLGTLSAGVAHEINNPLNYITSSAVILKQQLTKLQNQQIIPEAHAKVLNKLFASIETGSQRLVSIVHGLNEYARQSGNEMNECGLHHIIDNCLNILLHEYRNRIEIIKEFNKEEISFLSNNEALHQIFTNILVNAMQAIKKEGTILISTSIRSGKKIRIAIRDSGAGMDIETQRKIFDPFFTTKPPGKGTGLGLSIVYEAIKQLNGDIRVESELNKGAVFTIDIPYKPVNNE